MKGGMLRLFRNEGKLLSGKRIFYLTILVEKLRISNKKFPRKMKEKNFGNLFKNFILFYKKAPFQTICLPKKLKKPRKRLSIFLRDILCPLKAVIMYFDTESRHKSSTQTHTLTNQLILSLKTEIVSFISLNCN